MSQREHEADRDRALSFLHQFAGHVVDGGDVVGVDGMTQAEAVGEESGSQQDRVMVKSDGGPEPCSDVESEEDRIDCGDSGAKVSGGIVEQGCESRGHGLAVTRKSRSCYARYSIAGCRRQLLSLELFESALRNAARSHAPSNLLKTQGPATPLRSGRDDRVILWDGTLEGPDLNGGGRSGARWPRENS